MLFSWLVIQLVKSGFSRLNSALHMVLILLVFKLKSVVKHEIVHVCILLQEYPVSEKHHPLEPNHRLHLEKRHLVHRPADHEPRGARK